MESRREARLQEATRELTEDEQEEESRQRVKEDAMIAQVEKDFWEYTKQLEDGTATQVVAESRSGPGIPVGAPVLDSIIDDDALDRLLEFFEQGGTVDLQADDRQEQLTICGDDEAGSIAMPAADPETIRKAEEVVKMLTQQIHNLETRDSEQEGDEAIVEEETVEDPLSACTLQVPEFEVSESQETVTLRISLPAVLKVGQIDAEVVGRTKLELRVPELYSLDYDFGKPVDDDQMSCRFEKSSKTLVIKMPLLVS